MDFYGLFTCSEVALSRVQGSVKARVVQGAVAKMRAPDKLLKDPL